MPLPAGISWGKYFFALNLTISRAGGKTKHASTDAGGFVGLFAKRKVVASWPGGTEVVWVVHFVLSGNGTAHSVLFMLGVTCNMDGY